MGLLAPLVEGTLRRVKIPLFISKTHLSLFSSQLRRSDFTEAIQASAAEQQQLTFYLLL